MTEVLHARRRGQPPAVESAEFRQALAVHAAGVVIVTAQT